MSQMDLLPEYKNSFALVIGINEYEHSSPLINPVSDAEAVAAILESDFGFPQESICLLLNGEATGASIRKTYLGYSRDAADPDDRLLVFFAGHGYTQRGRRGEVGYLVPQDGNTSDLSTLIRWDELTKHADLIPAKHILFIMDACYGGLALQRSGLTPGSVRFLKQMQLRPSRQVLTAGKADEPVADAGGPLDGHSPFTGHLIEGLQGKASMQEGIITGNSLMAYVYERVSRDQDSQQTPHYGWIDGDGDFIFRADAIPQLGEEEEQDEDILVSIPASSQVLPSEKRDTIAEAKECLSEPKHKIRLHDLVSDEIRLFLDRTGEDAFAVQGVSWSVEEFSRRLEAYEEASGALRQVCAAIAHWGGAEHIPLLAKVLGRSTDRLESQSGTAVWLNLRWYPVILLSYATGIGALANNNYDAFASLMSTPIKSRRGSSAPDSLLTALGRGILEIVRTDAFKKLPERERQFVPMSEYIHKLLQPELDDLFFLGTDYERLFDRFEVLFALVHADADEKAGKGIWAPTGRFGYKFHRNPTNPLTEIIAEARAEGDKWLPLISGLFDGSLSRFEEIAVPYSDDIAKSGWLRG